MSVSWPPQEFCLANNLLKVWVKNNWETHTIHSFSFKDTIIEQSSIYNLVDPSKPHVEMSVGDADTSRSQQTCQQDIQHYQWQIHIWWHCYSILRCTWHKMIWMCVATWRNAGIEIISILALQHAFTWTCSCNATQAKKDVNYALAITSKLHIPQK